MQIIALLAFKVHEESDPPCWVATNGGFLPVHHLREHAWGGRYGELARYRGTPDSYRRNHQNSFKRALDRMVAAGYAEFRYIDDPRRLREYNIRHWQNQYRLTEKGLSVREKLPNTYSPGRFTVEHSAVICDQIHAEITAKLGPELVARLRGAIGR
jgi:hypothetical protein